MVNVQRYLEKLPTVGTFQRMTAVWAYSTLQPPQPFMRRCEHHRRIDPLSLPPGIVFRPRGIVWVRFVFDLHVPNDLRLAYTVEPFSLSRN